MILGKIDFTKGKKIRRNIINEMLIDNEVSRAIKNYVPSKKESSWIPKAIAWRSRFFLNLPVIEELKKHFKWDEVAKYN